MQMGYLTEDSLGVIEMPNFPSPWSLRFIIIPQAMVAPSATWGGLSVWGAGLTRRSLSGGPSLSTGTNNNQSQKDLTTEECRWAISLRIALA